MYEIVSKPTMLDRFWSKVDVCGADDCWNWLASLHGLGYGQFNTGRRIMNAHIIAYELQTGRQVPIGLEIDHLCRNRICMNGRHLEPVTKKENILRGQSPMAQQARQTHCIAGHALTAENVYWFGAKRNHRMCLTCKRRRDAEYQDRKRKVA